jgi:Asp-tRNA(Asn)/Glu-tRNA(Gln) amidotransferase C subunit
MNNEEIENIKDLAHALEASIEKKNTLTTLEFKEFHPLFKNDTDHNTDEYKALCSKWGFRISLYHPVNVVVPGSNEVVKTLPAMFNKVELINNVGNEGVVINKLTHAMATNHPLRTDVEESVDLFKLSVKASQDRDALNESAAAFSDLAKEFEIPDPDQQDEGTKKMVEDLEWE